jgi:hypothetical protein
LDASAVSHLGVFYGLLSAFFAGGTYVIIRFLGTANVPQWVLLDDLGDF